MFASATTATKLKKAYDAVVIGSGHNGLVAASYLRKSGLNVIVLERRGVIGGATITEEIVPGFKFSRCSYVLSLLRPIVYEQLELKKHGLKLHFRDPSSFTPIRGSKQSLLLGMDEKSNYDQIAQFSARDAEAFVKYEKFLSQLVDSIDPLFDIAPPRFASNTRGLAGNWDNLQSWRELMRSLGKFRGIFPDVYELLTAPIAKVLNKRFESDPLKATLATDGLIGSSLGPGSAGTGYVLLHHVMGRLEGRKGCWAYVDGGMGALADALAKGLGSAGGEIMCNAEVEQILVSDGKVQGVELKTGEQIKAKVVLSGVTVKETMLRLLPENTLDSSIKAEAEGIDYSSPVVKINIALSRIPDFTKSGNVVQPHHRCTIHLNTENMGMLEAAHQDYVAGKPSEKPFIEMVIPSSLDPTIAPSGAHVALLFIQYIPYAVTKKWSEKQRTDFAQKVFKQIDDYAPGFSSSVVGYEVLTPDILESTFGLTGGNIFHGALSWDQLFFSRPSANIHGYRTPVHGLYLCGSGCHPGGGVTGAPGRLGALTALQDFRRSKAGKMASSSENVRNGPMGVKSDLPSEVTPMRLAHVFDESPPALKPLMPKLLPLRSVTLVKLEKMQQEIEEAMKATKSANT